MNPTITITPEQQAALCRGESITIAPPKPPRPTENWNGTFIPAGKAKQMWHTAGIEAPASDPHSGDYDDDALVAVQTWLSRSDRVSTIRSSVAAAGGGLIVVCPRSRVTRSGRDVNAWDTRYKLATTDARYFRVDRNCNIEVGV